MEQQWSNNLQLVKEFIRSNNTLPNMRSSSYVQKSMARWIRVQFIKFSSDNVDSINYFIWNEFINDPEFIGFFFNDKHVWMNMFNQVKKMYIKLNHLPTDYCNPKLAKWFYEQLSDSKEAARKNMMLNDDLFEKWNEFLDLSSRGTCTF